jgi:predicted nucleic acid-binding protein
VPKAFLDTNVVAYAADDASPEKKAAARRLIAEFSPLEPPCISTQVLQEFYAAATKKLGIAPRMALGIVKSLRTWNIVNMDADDVETAIEASLRWQVSIWDALILTAAKKAGCSVVYSEDLSDGQKYASVRVINPFKRSP